jgi:thioredoxin 1
LPGVFSIDIIKKFFDRSFPQGGVMGAAVMINTTNFEAEVLRSDVPVLVDFWAEWCGPCKMLLPIVEELAAELAGRVKVCKANVDEVPDLAAQFNVMSIPTLMIFKNGEPVDQMVGALPKVKLLEKLKAHF